MAPKEAKKGKKKQASEPEGWLSEAAIEACLAALPESAVAEVAALVRQRAEAAYAAYAAELRLSQADRTRKSAEEGLRQVQSACEALQLSSRAMLALKLEETPLGAFFFKKLGEATNLILGCRLQAEIGEEALVTNATRKPLLDKLAKEVGPPAVRALAALAALKKGVESASGALLAAAEEANLYVKRVDKKHEKSAASAARLEAKDRAKAAATPREAVHALLAAHLASKGNLLAFPSDGWALDLLATSLELPPALKQAVDDLRGLTAEDESAFLERSKALA